MDKETKELVEKVEDAIKEAWDLGSVRTRDLAAEYVLSLGGRIPNFDMNTASDLSRYVRQMPLEKKRGKS